MLRAGNFNKFLIVWHVVSTVLYIYKLVSIYKQVDVETEHLHWQYACKTIPEKQIT